MRFEIASAFLVVSLAGCQVSSSIEAQAQLPKSISGMTPAKSARDACGVRTDPHKTNPEGGKQAIPAIVDDDGNFPGQFRYAGYTPGIRSETTMLSCDYNMLNIPVPTGYTPDWFGNWRDLTQGSDVTFGPGKLKGVVYSTTWLRGTKYFMYVYVTETSQLIESYPTSSVDVKRQSVRFLSPFQNGFVFPANTSISLEIVHPTP